MEMKYKCINKRGWQSERSGFQRIVFGRHKDVEGPKFGDIVTVIGEYYSSGKKYFYLLEWPATNKTRGFEARGFVPYDEDEETEWAINETKKITTQPVKLNQ